MEIGAYVCLAITIAFVSIPTSMFVARWYFRITKGWPGHWLRAKFGFGRGKAELAAILGIDRKELEALVPAYRECFIAKKRGGQRRLLIPNSALKRIQRRLLKGLLGQLRSHDCAMGFESGKSIVDNARAHVGKAVLIKLDIVDFFPSIESQIVEAYFRRIGWNADAAALLTRLCTYDDSLPQGAPTSPRLSNLVHFAFDSRLAKFVGRRRGAYTRYADDIAISFPKDYPRRIRGTIQYVRRLAKVFGLTIHVRGKLRILRGHQQQRVTGLVVNRKVQLPRRKRRMLRAVEHRLRVGRKATLSESQINGWRALQSMIEQQRE